MKIVIIGGVAAGAKAAAKIKRLLPNSSVDIYTDDTHVSYSACGLPYYIEGNFSDYRALLVRSVEEFKEAGIDVHLETKVEKILLAQQQVLVCSKLKAKLVPYDKLIITTGARPYIPPILGYGNLNNVFVLRKIEDGIKIREKMLNSKSAVIIGSGYIGIELLEAFVKNGLKVNVIERNERIMSVFDDEISDKLRVRLENSNLGDFRFHTGEEVIEFVTKNTTATGIMTASGKEFKADMFVICAGVKPNVEIAKDAGIELGPTGAIKVNKLMQTSVPNVFAAGDCVEERHLINRQPVWIPLGSTANKEGRCAAMNAAGVYSEFEGVLGSSVTRCLNTTMSMTGLTERDAQKFGYSTVSVIISKSDMVGYMPEADDITLKIVADKITGLLLGGQAIGSVGADKRINALASALVGHLTVEEFRNNDLTYSPPYSTTIDPLLNAMDILCSKIIKPC